MKAKTIELVGEIFVLSLRIVILLFPLIALFYVGMHREIFWAFLAWENALFWVYPIQFVLLNIPIAAALLIYCLFYWAASRT